MAPHRSTTSGSTPTSRRRNCADLRIGQHVDLYVDMYGGQTAVQGPHLRLHDGHRIDAGPLAAGECHGKFRQNRAAASRAHRIGRLRSGQGPAVHRPFRYALRLCQRKADGTSCRRSSFSLTRASPPAKRWPRTPEAPANDRRSPCRFPWPARRSIPGWSPRSSSFRPSWRCSTRRWPNVALRYIAGGLSAAVADSEWVITSYLAANAIIVPISGWLAARLGRRNYFLLSIAVFTIAFGPLRHGHQSRADHPLPRLQGLAGGGLQPSSQGICWTPFPGEAGGRDDAVRRRGLVGARRRSDARRLDHGTIRVALDLLHQRAGRTAGAGGLLLLCCRRPRLSQGRAAAAEEAAVASTRSAWACWSSPWPPGKWCSARGKSGIGSATPLARADAGLFFVLAWSG